MTPNNRRPYFPWFRVVVATAMAILTLSAVTARASIARAVPFDDKVAAAESIILGTCLRNESKLDPSGRWIVTYSTFKVESTLKGSEGGEITIVTPGGSVNSVHQATVGVPQFQPGDRDVLFVRKNDLGPSVLYFDQGTYVVTEQERGHPIVAPVQSSLVLVDTQTGKAVGAEKARPLAEFQGDIRASIERVRHRDFTAASAARLAASKDQKPPDWKSDFRALVQRNKMVLLLALAGIILAAFPLFKRR